MNPRPILIATCIAICFVVGVYLTGRYTLSKDRPDDSPITATGKAIEPSEKTIEPKQDGTVLGDDTRKTETNLHPSQTLNPPKVIADSQSGKPIEPEPPTTEAEKPETKAGPVSPHGFGPYPKIPEGAPISRFSERDPVNMELLGRVMVKKWNEGERFTAGVFEDGKVYLIYPDTIYVQWKEEEDLSTGEKTRYIGGSLGPTTLTHEQRTSGEIPPDLRVIDMENAGLDPYEILDLH